MWRLHNSGHREFVHTALASGYCITAAVQVVRANLVHGLLASEKLWLIKSGLTEPEPPFLAGAGAIFLVRLLLLLLLHCKYFILTGP